MEEKENSRNDQRKEINGYGFFSLKQGWGTFR
jgi:hypothetical protein